MATIPLNALNLDRLSISALQYILSCTHEKEKYFATPEYEVFRYSAVMAAWQVSNDAYITLTERFPSLEQIENLNLIQVENKFILERFQVN